MNDLIPILVLLIPLGAALTNGISLLAGDQWLSHRLVQRITVGATLLSFLGAIWIFAGVLIDPTPRRVLLFEWIISGDLTLRMGLLIDLLSALMVLMVTGFALVIGRFSINYMHREPGFTRYFTAYALFVFAMLVLVLGDNYVMLFAGWEAVGVCSYLLIGQYYDRTSAARAGTEAFITNRVGDAGFLIGILILLNEFGTVDYSEVAARASEVDPFIASAAALFLLLGAIGKSAQLPLGSWLAKAMEGPTPSSALIHAATMVTAGVYLIVRSQDLYNAAPSILLLIAIIGAATALYGSMVGQTVSDIKGLLATSTTTQLGFMFLACGLGAYSVAVFHLLAHAFLKSYLFLTAPSILHHLHGRLDPALKEAHPEAPNPYTLVTLIAGALVAIPLIMNLVAGTDQLMDWGITTWVLLAGGLLALFTVGHYAYGLTHATFVEHGHAADDHHHDNDQTGAILPAGPVVWPLALIAVAAALGIVLQVLPGGLDGSWFRSLIAPVISEARGTGAEASAALRWTLLVLLLAMVAYAWFTAVFLGRFRMESSVNSLLHQWRALYVASLNRLWIDLITQKLVVRNVHRLARALDRFDSGFIDRLARAPATIAVGSGNTVSWLDSQVRDMAEQGPSVFAINLSQIAALIERAVIGGTDTLVKAGAGLAGMTTMLAERYVIGGFEALLHVSTTAFARVGLVFEKILARPIVAVAVIAIVLALGLFGVR